MNIYKSDDEGMDRIRKARKNFAAMVVTYLLGVFNDNFFKQSILLIALTSGMKDIQGLATIIFILPYMLAAAPAGWLADRYIKKNIVICAKILEFIAMICGASGLLILQSTDAYFSLSWVLILSMLGIMGLQSSIFSPALIRYLHI